MLKLFIFVAALFTLLAGGRRARAAVLARDAARSRLRTLFLRFIEANRTLPLSEADVERFLVDTVDVESLYSGSSIPRLRADLHDQALRLSRLRIALEEGWAGPNRHDAIATGCHEKHVWFAGIARSADTRFDEANRAESDMHGLYSRGIERFNRLIRA